MPKKNPLIDRKYLEHGFVMGTIAGHKVLVEKGIAERYSLEKIEHTDEVLIEEPYIHIHISICRSHTFMVFDKASLNPVAEHLSRGTKKLVTVRMKGYNLKGWDRGQVVIGYRSLKFFEPSCSKKDDKLSKF